MGVYYHKKTGKWQSCMQVQTEYIHFGLFATKEEAIAADEAGKLKYADKIAENRRIRSKRHKQNNIVNKNANVYWDSKRKKWEATVLVTNKSRKIIGYYDNLTEALRVAEEAKPVKKHFDTNIEIKPIKIKPITTMEQIMEDDDINYFKDNATITNIITVHKEEIIKLCRTLIGLIDNYKHSYLINFFHFIKNKDNGELVINVLNDDDENKYTVNFKQTIIDYIRKEHKF